MRRSVIGGAACAALFLLLGLTSAAWGDTNGAAALFVSGATHTPTHWNIPIGVPTTAELRGVSPAECGDPLPATITVWVKSSMFGNTMLTATRIDLTSDYTFTYTPPAVANGNLFDACGTTIVAYCFIGRNANNDYTDDDLRNYSGASASGFRFVDASGPLDCPPVKTEPMSWGVVKSMYR